MRIGVFGGTFDPVHVGHLLLAERARESLGLDRVLFVPAGRPWRKAGTEIAPAADRLAMLHRAVAGNPAFGIDTSETQQPGPSYTADTLARLQEENPSSELYFILGQDALLDLPYWREPQRIVELAQLGVAQRPGSPRLGLDELDSLLPGLSSRVQWIDMPLIEISASEVRRRVREGLSVRYMLPDEVERYIRKSGLYLVSPAPVADSPASD